MNQTRLAVAAAGLIIPLALVTASSHDGATAVFLLQLTLSCVCVCVIPPASCACSLKQLISREARE